MPSILLDSAVALFTAASAATVMFNDVPVFMAAQTYAAKMAVR